MLSAAAVLCSLTYHLGRALATGYPISFISPSPSDMIGVALFLGMLAAVVIPRCYYCQLALRELNEWYGSPEVRRRKHRWFSGIKFDVLAIVLFAVLAMVPFFFATYVAVPFLRLLGFSVVGYGVVGLLFKHKSQKRYGDSARRAWYGLFAELFWTAATPYVMLTVAGIILAFSNATWACLATPVVIWVFEYLVSCWRHWSDGGAPGESLRFAAKEGAKLIRNWFVPVLFVLMALALWFGGNPIPPMDWDGVQVRERQSR